MVLVLINFINKLGHRESFAKIPFVFLMICFLGLWNYFLNQDPYLSQENQTHLSSIAKSDVPQTESQARALLAFNKRLYTGNLSSPNASSLLFENAEECSIDRLYLKDDLEKVGEIFRLPRGQFSEAEIPPDCILYAMRSFIYSPKRTSSSYSYCGKNVGRPLRGKKTPCITKEYVYSIYNAYVDVMDCLEIPQTDLLPKLLNESGFHTNVLGGGMDAGVGQLTADAIKSVLQMGNFNGTTKSYLDYHLEEMRQSGKDSCARVLSNKDLVSAVSPKEDQRCSMIVAPANPLRNIFYTGIFYRYILLNQTGILYSKGKNYLLDNKEWIPWEENGRFKYGGYIKSNRIEEKLAQAGIKDYNMNAIKQMMITLGYNAGMKTAIIFLDNYLKARITAKMPVAPKDFDFQTEDFGIFRPLKDPTKEAARQKKVAKIMQQPFRGTFPIYLRLVQKTGTRGYLSLVASKHKILNSVVGENKCTSQNFLQF